MWPFTKRRKSRVAFYEDGVLTVNLQAPLQEPDVFRANCHNYALVLQQRSTMPVQLAALLSKLFERGVVVDCSIKFCSRLELRLTRLSLQDPSKELLPGKRLEQFQHAFTEITGQNIDVNWRHGNSRRAWGQRRARLEAQNFVDAFAIVVQGAAQGIQTAASIKILSSD